VRAEVAGTSHYWNRLPSGVEVDLTREQFGSRSSLRPDNVRLETRDYVLSFRATVARYKRLIRRVRQQLETESSLGAATG